MPKSQITNSKPQYDLKKRILTFVLAIIQLVRKLPRDSVNIVFINQIIRSATSIGANYEEADGSRSKKEFISIMGIIRKEAKETKYWLRLIRLSNKKEFYNEVDRLGIENEELIKIFAKIIINSREE
ncbi:MAG: four helix bundle protein [Saprospiraceae bacterium]|nr:four helix bundle protein [Saprospiraceae bacterium]